MTDSERQLLLTLAEKLSAALRSLSRLQSEMGREGDSSESWDEALEIDQLVEATRGK